MNRYQRRAHAAKGIDVGDTTVKFGGRTLEVKILINTDESLNDVVSRLLAPARGPAKRMVVVTGGEIDIEAGKKFWEDVLPHVEQQARSGGVS